MKKLSLGILVLFVAFVFILGISLFGRGITGQTVGQAGSGDGAILSCIAAVLAIGVLIVAGFQHQLSANKK